LQTEVEHRLREGEIIDQAVIDLSRLPREESIAYRSMKAHDMHLRCISAETRKETADSGVATTFLHPSQGRGAHGGLEEMENVEYVGWVKEIVE
jgi:hypothetical protein